MIRRLRTDYENGRSYYPYNDRPLVVLPRSVYELPSAEHLAWHNENVFLD